MSNRLTVLKNSFFFFYENLEFILKQHLLVSSIILSNFATNFFNIDTGSMRASVQLRIIFSSEVFSPLLLTLYIKHIKVTVVAI